MKKRDGSKKNASKSEEGEEEKTGGEQEERESEDKGEEEGKWKSICPPFGVKSYHHQFYQPQTVKNPDLYEFPPMNLVYPDEGDIDPKRNGYSTILVVVILAGLLMSIISGVTLSLQYLAPNLWLQMTGEFEAMEMWTLSGFLGGILIITTALLIRLVMLLKENLRGRGGIAGLCTKESAHHSPTLQGNIPLIQEIQAVQPPTDSLAPNAE